MEGLIRNIVLGVLMWLAGIGNAFVIGDFEYTILSEEEATAEVTLSKDYNKHVEELVFPASVMVNGKRYSVISVGNNPVASCKFLHRVTLPTSIKKITAYSFQASTLCEINIEAQRLEELGIGVFMHCEQLESFNLHKLPNNPGKLGSEVFYNTGIKEVIWPEDIDIIPIKLFAYSQLQKITFPETLKEIKEEAFRGCEGLDTISLPGGVSVGYQAFESCYNIRHLEFGEGCKLGVNSFGNNVMLEKIILPSYTQMPYCPFYNMLNLKEVEIYPEIEFGNQLLGYNVILGGPRPDDTMPAEYEGRLEFNEDYGWVYMYYPHYKQGLEQVTYHTGSPQAASSYLFLPENYRTATLYVEPEGIEKAEETTPWNRFKSIKPIVVETGVNEINDEISENTCLEPNGYYTLTGHFAGKSQADLHPGIYIERKNGESRKIIIK